MKPIVLTVAGFVGLFLTACTPTLYLWPTGNAAETPTTSPSAAIANPAAVFCEQNTGQHIIQTGAQGGQVGYCLFSDRSYCEAWSYYNGECQPGDQPDGDRILLPGRLSAPLP